MGDGQMVIRMHASSLNPADYKQRKEPAPILSYKFPQVSIFAQLGHLQCAQWYEVYGFDFSGVVEITKSDQFSVGQEVFGMCKGVLSLSCFH